MGEKKRETERERERDEESMRRGEEKKRAKTERNSNFFGVVKKYLIGKEMGKKGVIKVQNLYFISMSRLIRKYILSFNP